MASSLPNGPGHPSPTQSIPAHPSPSRPILVHPASRPVLGQPQPQKRPPAPQAPPYFPDQLRYVPSALTAPLALECGLPRPRRPYLRRARPPLNSATSKSKLGSWRYQGLSRTGKDSEPRAAALLKTPFLSRPVPVRLRPPRRRSQLCPETPAAPWPGPHPAAPGVPSGVAADSRLRPREGARTRGLSALSVGSRRSPQARCGVIAHSTPRPRSSTLSGRRPPGARLSPSPACDKL